MGRAKGGACRLTSSWWERASADWPRRSHSPAAGHRVIVLEAAERAGGKAGVQVVDGVRFDTGPSVLTLPHIARELLALADPELADGFVLRHPTPSFRYLFDDGVVVDAFPEPEDTLFSGGGGAGGVGSCRNSPDSSTMPRRSGMPRRLPFVFGAAPSVSRLLAMGPSAWWQLRRADPLRTMWGAIRRQVRQPHLRAILARFATYNGSDPRRAPATLNCIAHVELTLGGFGVEGGMGGLVDRMVEACERLGVEVRTSSPVARLVVGSRGVVGVETVDGAEFRADAVVANADAAHVLGELMPEGTSSDHRCTAASFDLGMVWGASSEAQRGARGSHGVDADAVPRRVSRPLRARPAARASRRSTSVISESATGCRVGTTETCPCS